MIVVRDNSFNATNNWKSKMNAIEQISADAIAATVKELGSLGVFSRAACRTLLQQNLVNRGVHPNADALTFLTTDALRDAIMDKAIEQGFDDDYAYTFWAGWLGVDTAGKSTRAWAVALADDFELGGRAFDAGRALALSQGQP